MSRTVPAGNTISNNHTYVRFDMPSQNITDFFKRPHFALTNPETPARNKKNASNSPAAECETSPLTEPPSSSFLSKSSPLPLDSPAYQLKDSLWSSVEDSTKDVPQPSLQSADTADTTSRDLSVGTSFTSQRIVKNGKEVVISSDGEDTDSIASLESPDDLLMRFTNPNKDVTTKEETKNDSTDTGRTLRSGKTKNVKKSFKFESAPKYKFSLDSLVTATVDDNETEAAVERLRAASDEKNSARQNADSAGSDTQQLNEGILTSALDGQDDPEGLQRLLDAVRRTEAFDQEKAWFFFDHKSDIPPKPEFPVYSIASGTYMATLRDPQSRERAFHSGIVEFALSRQFLPDELVTWIFHSVPTEPRDHLRQTYCRIFKHVTAERVKSLIRPDDINVLFQRLGASSKALSLSEPIIADANPTLDSFEGKQGNKAALLSVLDLLRGAADLFAYDTQERLLCMLFRLTFDISLTSDAIICSELEKAITATLEGIPEASADDFTHQISISLYDTIKDAVFQSRLLRHILPTSSWIALLRCRLAVAFLIRDPSPLTEAPETVFNIRRITNVLKERRFNVKSYKRKGHHDYDYGELGANTSLLNIAIDPAWSGFNFPDKDAERDYNAEMDLLALQIKILFSSIEDSGVSHLKRTLAKGSLEALHYRIVYSVRSKPPPKRTMFNSYAREDKKNTLLRHFQKKARSDTATEKNTNMPIRKHEASP